MRRDEPSILPAQNLRCVLCASNDLAKLHHLARFVGAEIVYTWPRAPRDPTSIDAVLVTGQTSSSAALAYAARHEIPIWRLEAGWIRSSSARRGGGTTYSLSMEQVEPDGTVSERSLLEQLLALDGEALQSLASGVTLDAVRDARTRLVAAEVTRHNYRRSPRLPTWEADPRPLVLVIDQLRDEATKRRDGMDQARYLEMLEAAIAENPDARVVVRGHPDADARRRPGFLEPHADRYQVEVFPGDDNPVAWIKRAARIYVGTSQLGYEALLAERPVTVFGWPFYAGRGLTDDRFASATLKPCRTIDELFLATHWLYVRYRHPLTGGVWTLPDCLDHLELQRVWHARNAREHRCIDIARWKKGFMRQYLASPDGRVRFEKRETLDRVSPGDVLVTWGYRTFDGTIDAPTAPDHAALLRVEDGFLRSRGLGSDFVLPCSLAFDGRGLYFDATVPSDLECLLETHECDDVERARGARMTDAILASRASKYNVASGGLKPAYAPADKLCVLVVGQVEGDQSLLRGSPALRTNRALLEAVREARPDSFIVFRPHPDVASGNRVGAVPDALQNGLADAVDTETPLGDWLHRCDELHTMTSQAGFEALLHGCTVVTWGAPFYAGRGLTCDRLEMPRRTRRRTLDELVFLALVRYPRYLDPNSGDFIEPEDLLRHWQAQAPVTLPTGGRLRRLRNLVRALRHAA